MDSEIADSREALRKATKKAMDYLARREHSCHELHRKLASAGFEPETAEEVIGRLQSQGLVSDMRFTEAYIRYRASRGQGPQRIRSELAEKGVAGELVSELMSAGNHDWYRLAATVRTKKFGDTMPTDYKERARQARFLQYRGFDGDQIRQALDEID